MESKEKILSDLRAEIDNLKSFKYINKEIIKRIEELNSQIKDIECGDSFREYELKENDLIEEDLFFDEDDDIGDDDYGFISESFHDPSKDY